MITEGFGGLGLTGLSCVYGVPLCLICVGAVFSFCSCVGVK